MSNKSVKQRARKGKSYSSSLGKEEKTEVNEKTTKNHPKNVAKKLFTPSVSLLSQQPIKGIVWCLGDIYSKLVV